MENSDIRTGVLLVEHKVTRKNLIHAIAAMLEEGKAVTRDSTLETLRSLLYRRGESFCGQNPWHYLPAEKIRLFERSKELSILLFPEIE